MVCKLRFAVLWRVVCCLRFGRLFVFAGCSCVLVGVTCLLLSVVWRLMYIARCLLCGAC